MTRTDHYALCWGCSTTGERGLRFDWSLVDGIVHAEYVVADAYQGAPGVAHGGIVATLLDEACGQAVRLVVTPAVTARLDVRYLAPVPVEEPVTVRAEVVEAEERRTTAEATIREASGLVLAHARGEYVRVRPEHFLSTPRGRERGLDWLTT